MWEDHVAQVPFLTGEEAFWSTPSLPVQGTFVASIGRPTQAIIRGSGLRLGSALSTMEQAPPCRVVAYLYEPEDEAILERRNSSLRASRCWHNRVRRGSRRVSRISACRFCLILISQSSQRT
jgi:hypothetical protein